MEHVGRAGRKPSAFRWGFSVTTFGDDFRWWITKKLPSSGELIHWLVVYAPGCPCQMGVGWDFVLSIRTNVVDSTTVAEVFRDAYKIPAWLLRFPFQTELVS